MYSAVKKNLPKYLKDGAIVVDVRSPEEYRGGHVKGSLNIPLPELPDRLGQIDMNKTILLCCASGGRSGVAATILKNKGFKDVINAGPWSNLA